VFSCWPTHCTAYFLCHRRASWRCPWLYKEDKKDTARYFGFSATTNERDAAMTKTNASWGTTLDEFLDEGEIREAVHTEAITRVIAWQLSQEMQRLGVTKAVMAERMHTSRAQVDRILKAKGNVTVESLQRAATLVGRELRLQLV
jgi:hypothetical protein